MALLPRSPGLGLHLGRLTARTGDWRGARLAVPPRSDRQATIAVLADPGPVHVPQAGGSAARGLTEITQAVADDNLLVQPVLDRGDDLIEVPTIDDVLEAAIGPSSVVCAGRAGSSSCQDPPVHRAKPQAFHRLAGHVATSATSTSRCAPAG